MEQKRISLSGIDRSSDDGISKDGVCMELINARLKHGSIEPIGKPILVSGLPVVAKKVYYHSMADKIILLATNGVVYALNSDYSTPEMLSNNLIGADRVEFMGNLCCFFVSNEVRYVIYKNGSYYYLGTKPELPTLSVTQSSKVGQVRSTMEINSNDVESMTMGYYDNAIYDLNNDGYYTGPVLVRHALRLSNGDYICHSPIQLIYQAERIDVKFESSVSSSTSTAFYEYSPLHYSPEGRVGETSYHNFGVFGTKRTFTLSDVNLESWKGLVASVDVFVSPLFLHESEKKEGKSYETYILKDFEKYKKSVTDAYMFYKVAEFSIDGTLDNSLDNVSMDSLSVQKTLTDDQFSNNKYSAECSYIYNSMLHLGCISESFFKGYNKLCSRLNETSSIDAEIYTTISTTQGNVVVKSNTKLSYPTMAPFIGYPDCAATDMRIVYTKDNVRYSKLFALKAHAYLNYAHYIDITSTPRPYSINYGISLTGWTEDNTTYSEQNTVIQRNNVLKVSSLNNPLSYPADQTYQPSTEKIVGMCANTQALSQGQFGQHPLYVFCGDGVYAMSVGSGSVTYSSQHPITRDVCINVKSIKGIDNAVVFASKRGLMIISGTNTNVISEDLEGYLPSCFLDPLLQKVVGVASMNDIISSVIFRDYLENAEVGYNYQENEIIVSNASFPYSYVYSINGKIWSKLSVKVDSFTNKYPECYALVDGSIYDLQNNHRSIATILMVTKPIKFGTNTHKKILQTALRGVIKPSKSDLYLRGEQVMFRGDTVSLFSDIGMYILGSNDAEHFTLEGGREKMTDIRDLITKMNKSKSYKYFVVVLVGGVRTDVSINYLECIVEEAFGNRLR